MILWICRFTVRYPLPGIVLAALITIPAFHQVKRIKLRTNLLRLLPRSTRAAVNTVKLDKYVSSDGGHFFFLISQTQTNKPPQFKKLHAAVEEAVARIKKLPNVQMVIYTWPSQFIKKYRLMLVPERSLKLIYEKVLGWKAEASPVGVNILEEDDTGPRSFSKREDWSEMESNFKQYANYYQYHRSNNGYQFGIKVYTREGVSSFEKLIGLYRLLEKEADHIKSKYGFYSGVGGSHRNKIAEFQVIQQDLSTSGMISFIMIVLLMLLAFRSVPAVIIVLLPLLVGLVWGFAFVPATVETLNIITAFLMLILFGMGIDYSIHLVKRFRTEICNRSPLEALGVTFTQTGISVIVSALTTAFALSLLAFSDFKGFSEFGLITAISIITILISMFVLLPSLLILAHRYRILKPLDSDLKRAWLPGTKSTAVFTVLSLAGVLLTASVLKFDFSFRNLQFDKSKVRGFTAVQRTQGKIYSGSGSPGALFVADDLQSLDSMINLIKSNKSALKGKTQIGRLSSIRDYASAPGSAEWKRRYAEIINIKAEFKGVWWKKIKQPDHRRWAEQIRTWDPPGKQPVPLKLFPPSIIKANISRDGSGKYLLGLHPAYDRKDGRNAMAFAGELYGLKLPAGVQGPIGETPIFAEILWIVTSEAFLLAMGTLMGIFILVWSSLRGVKETIVVMTPLASGIVISFGILALLGIKLNLFSVIVIPALLGMGVDGGIHYFNHWQHIKGDTRQAQKELLLPLSATTITTMVGYSGMMFAGHPGIRSIGVLACIGLFVVWALSLFYLPGLLNILKNRGILKIEG